MKKIMIASRNIGKINEYSEMLVPYGYQVLSLLDFDDLNEVEESGETFLENAMIKARYVATKYNLPTIADDSGLSVDYLGGAPGVKSKRYSEKGTDAENNKLLLEVMSGVFDRKARFICQIVYYDPFDEYKHYEGILDGEIGHEIIMGNGFGYDPVFWIPALNKTMSQCTMVEKNSISHRGIALGKLLEDLRNHD